jgi:hypothetical protein
MGSLNDITINRLHINAPKEDAQRISFTFENQSWFEQDNSQQWVFVRELLIKGDKNELNQQAATLLKHKLQAAVHGGDAVAPSANAVVFNSLPELLVFLLRDSLNDTLLAKWYWGKWHSLSQINTSNRIFSVLSEYIESLPAVVQKLYEHKLLATVWQQLGHESAGQLLMQLNSKTPLKSTISLESTTFALVAVDKKESLSSATVDKIQVLIRTCAKPLSQWQGLFKGFSPSDNLIQLAVAIIVRTYIPYISYEQFIQLKPRLIEKLISPNMANGSVFNHVENPRKPKKNRVNETMPYDRHRTLVNKFNSNSEINSKKNQSKIFDLQEYKETTGLTQDVVVKETANKINKYYLSRKNSSKKNNHHKKNDETVSKNIFNDSNENEFLAEPGFNTQFGGFFYLINLLANQQCQKLLERDTESTSAWLWLFDLSRRLSSELDKPLLTFVARQAQIEEQGSVETLLLLPPIKVMDDVAELLKKPLKNKNLWDGEWLTTPAQVLVTESHIDCFYSLDNVRLDVRLMGLDINPGWVPWLGRIVTFHYND